MLQFKPLSLGFGTEASGIDLSRPLSDAEFAELERALYAHQVLVFRGQSLAAQQYVSFARRFGPPEPHVMDQFHHPEFPDILVLSNVRKDGRPIGLADGGSYYHTDYSYLEIPARATTLYSIQVPKVGGDTLFANQYAAYDDLPEAMKNELEGKIALHEHCNRDSRDPEARTTTLELNDRQKAKLSRVKHPIVRRHPHTGRKALYGVSASSVAVEGMTEKAGLKLLDDLKEHATQRKYVFSLTYGMGDVVIWDNASLLHSATLIDPNDARTLWRITIKEPAPVAHARAVNGPASAQGTM
jgi:taurine dioxygenase